MRTAGGTREKFDDYVIGFALDCVVRGEQVALITLVKIEGSSPRSLGAQMAVSSSGEWAGYLSGGCIERAVVGEALAAIEVGKNRRVRYGRDSKYMDIQLPCGSAIELVFDVGLTEGELEAVDSRIRARKSAVLHIPEEICGAPGRFMVRRYSPRRKLIVIGVGPAAVHLVKLGHISDFEIVLLSPDDATLTGAGMEGIAIFPIAHIGMVPNLEADDRSAIVFMFHDHNWERKLIPAALDTPAFYIGAMGSRRTHRQRVEQLERSGLDPVRLERIRGPAGLFSGAKSAPDIAMSILAEIIQIERSRNIDYVDITSNDSMESLTMVSYR